MARFDPEAFLETAIRVQIGSERGKQIREQRQRAEEEKDQQRRLNAARLLDSARASQLATIGRQDLTTEGTEAFLGEVAKPGSTAGVIGEQFPSLEQPPPLDVSRFKIKGKKPDTKELGIIRSQANSLASQFNVMAPGPERDQVSQLFRDLATATDTGEAQRILGEIQSRVAGVRGRSQQRLERQDSVRGINAEIEGIDSAEKLVAFATGSAGLARQLREQGVAGLNPKFLSQMDMLEEIAAAENSGDSGRAKALAEQVMKLNETAVPLKKLNQAIETFQNTIEQMDPELVADPEKQAAIARGLFKNEALAQQVIALIQSSRLGFSGGKIRERFDSTIKSINKAGFKDQPVKQQRIMLQRAMTLAAHLGAELDIPDEVIGEMSDTDLARLHNLELEGKIKAERLKSAKNQARMSALRVARFEQAGFPTRLPIQQKLEYDKLRATLRTARQKELEAMKQKGVNVQKVNKAMELPAEGDVRSEVKLNIFDQKLFDARKEVETATTALDGFLERVGAGAGTRIPVGDNENRQAESGRKAGVGRKFTAAERNALRKKGISDAAMDQMERNSGLRD